MKNTIKFLGIIAIVAVIGFSMAACSDDGGGGGGGGGGDSVISISGEPKIGATITATVKGNYEIEWYITDTETSTSGNYAGNSDTSFTVPFNAEGKYIRAEAMNMDNGQKYWSNAIGPITE